MVLGSVGTGGQDDRGGFTGAGRKREHCEQDGDLDLHAVFRALIFSSGSPSNSRASTSTMRCAVSTRSLLPRMSMSSTGQLGVAVFDCEALAGREADELVTCIHPPHAGAR